MHQRQVHPGPLVLTTAPLRSPTPTTDRDRTVSRRSEPSSRTALMGGQPNPWNRIQLQDAMRADIEVPNPAVDVNSWAGSACYPQGSFYPLSDGPSIRHRRITNPDFRPCSICRCRSQARLCIYTRRLVSIQTERTFGRLRYSLGVLFGRRPPQSNCPPGTVQFYLLGFRIIRGGIPPAAPGKLASSLPGLPHILYVIIQNPMPGCSKAPWGLSV